MKILVLYPSCERLERSLLMSGRVKSMGWTCDAFPMAEARSRMETDFVDQRVRQI